MRRLEDVVVELQTSDGRTGRGEAPPTAAITGETLDSLIAALRDCICPRLVGRDIEEFRALLDEVQEAMVGNPSAKAAADIALWDLYAQYCGLPVYKMLGGGTPRLETDLTISVNNPDIMATDAEYGINSGYNVLKSRLALTLNSILRAWRPCVERRKPPKSASTPTRPGHPNRQYGC